SSRFRGAAPPRDPHSFPTRRSSDLREQDEALERRLEDADGRERAVGPAPAREAVPQPRVAAPDPEDRVRLVLDALDAEPNRVERSEEHTSELQSPYDLVCRLLLEKK